MSAAAEGNTNIVNVSASRKFICISFSTITFLSPNAFRTIIKKGKMEGVRDYKNTQPKYQNYLKEKIFLYLQSNI